MTYEDKIEIDRSHGYPLTYFNAGDYKSRGVEWEIDVSPNITQAGFLQNMTLRSAGYWADPTAEDVEGKDYQTGPKFQTSIGILYSSEKMTLDLNMDILTSRPRGLDDTAPLNFFGKFKLFKGHLTLGVDNIFDEQVEVTGDMTDTTTNKYAYYGIGRMFRAGYEIVF
jgi:iron complex outermembrane receptor protein